jgi:hypothetical protein
MKKNLFGTIVIICLVIFAAFFLIVILPSLANKTKMLIKPTTETVPVKNYITVLDTANNLLTCDDAISGMSITSEHQLDNIISEDYDYDIPCKIYKCIITCERSTFNWRLSETRTVEYPVIKGFKILISHTELDTAIIHKHF